MALPIQFPEANSTLGGGPAARYGTSDDVLDLAVYKDGQRIISCWRLSWRERLSALLFGRAWLHVWSGQTHSPVAVEAKRTIFTVVSPEPQEDR
jgi:hypothetical protein